MMRTYGASGYFFTVAPSMNDNKFAMRLMQRQRNEEPEEPEQDKKYKRGKDTNKFR